MSTNVILFGWNRSLPGREMVSAQHFQEFTEYLGMQQRSGQIDSFEPVFIEPHGGTLNGFILIRGEADKLSQLTGSADWRRHQTRAILHLDGALSVRGLTGAAVAEQMQLWIGQIPK